MSRRIIPVLCALAVAVVPATALSLSRPRTRRPPPPMAASCTATPSTTCRTSRTEVPDRRSAYEQAISGDTKGNLPRAIAPAGTPARR